MPGIYIDSHDDRPYGPGNPDYEYDKWRQEQDDAAELARAQAEIDICSSDWWKEKLGELSLSKDAADCIARCMREVNGACRGNQISLDAITTALSNLQARARADARDEK